MPTSESSSPNKEQQGDTSPELLQGDSKREIGYSKDTWGRTKEEN
jgi:hypothetical protein